MFFFLGGGVPRVDAEETVESLWQDAMQGRLTAKGDDDHANQTDEMDNLLSQKGVRHICWQGWKRIEKAEEQRGKLLGKEREKITSVDEMIQTALSSSSSTSHHHH